MVQRFLELEEYRLLALIPLPDAKRLLRELLSVERSLNAAIASAASSSRYNVSVTGKMRRVAAEKLLEELFSLSAQCEEVCESLSIRETLGYV